MPCCFFQKPIYRQAPFAENAIPFSVVKQQCEYLFGMASKQFQKAIPHCLIAEYALIFHTGFHTIYNITALPDTMQSNPMLHVAQLQKFNELITAETLREKREIFLSHIKTFATDFLKDRNIMLESAYAQQAIKAPDEKMMAALQSAYPKTQVATLKMLYKYIETVLLGALDLARTMPSAAPRTPIYLI